MVQMILSNLVSAAVMFCVCAAVPFVWWLVTARKKEHFFRWLGFYKPKLQCPVWVLLLFAVVYYVFWNFDFTVLFDQASLNAMADSENVAANVYTGLGAAAILPALVENFLGNGLPEELFFRGFLTKRFNARFGEKAGFVLQAVCFGLMHNLLYLAAGIPVSLQCHAVLFLFTGGGALLLGFLNEKLCNGSILPGILLHGLGNFVATMLTAF